MQMAAPAAIECAIRAEPGPESLRIEAVARSAKPVSGQYRLFIDKRSASGSSTNTQSGAFVLEGGSDQVLTTVVLDRSALGHSRAELVLQSDQEKLTCTWP